MKKNNHEQYIHSKNLLTIEEHDKKIEDLISTNQIVSETIIPAGTIRMSGVGCPKCGFRLIDKQEIETDSDGNKFRNCGCFRCGTTVWRKVL
jgi:hypothetical protein